MDLLQRLRLFFYKKRLNRILNVNEKITRKSIRFDRAKFIGILFDASDMSYRDEVVKYAEALKKKGKKVKLLGFINTKEAQENLTFDFFNKKQLDFSLLPKSEIVNQFIKQPFDLLINLFFHENLPLEYISAASKARFRVGKHSTQTHSFDLMIDMKESKKGLTYFTKQLELILQKMNKPAYEPAAT